MSHSTAQKPVSSQNLSISSQDALEIWCLALTDSVRQEAPDLSARQMALLLTVYLTPPPHTVRGLAQHLRISKPAVTRALDRLSSFGFCKRKIDENDRRNVFIQRTVKGSVYLRDFSDLVLQAAQNKGL